MISPVREICVVTWGRLRERLVEFLFRGTIWGGEEEEEDEGLLEVLLSEAKDVVVDFVVCLLALVVVVDLVEGALDFVFVEDEEVDGLLVALLSCKRNINIVFDVIFPSNVSSLEASPMTTGGNPYIIYLFRYYRYINIFMIEISLYR